MTVFLVGAGPGDPGLLTVRGAEALAMADVVVYDRLSVGALLELAPPEAERISVAKSAGQAVLPQDDINALLVEKAKQGLTVVRLKGGDPFVFARGGEEAAALAAAGLHYEVVPGVTSAIAVPAYAGIPVTLRHSSTSFTVITGHEDPDKSEEVNWEAAAQLGGTIVILMGVGRLPKIVDRLLAGGLAPDTPAAAIRWGTRPEQHTVRSTLSAIAREPLASPSVIVVGQVAGCGILAPLFHDQVGDVAEVAGVPFHAVGFRALHAAAMFEVITEWAGEPGGERGGAETRGGIRLAGLPLPISMPAHAGFGRFDAAEQEFHPAWKIRRGRC